MASWHFELCENTKSFQAHGKFFGKHIRLFTSDLVELTSAQVISNYEVSNLLKVFPRT